MTITRCPLLLALCLLSGAVFADPTPPAPTKAEQYFAQGQFEVARQAFNDASQDESNDIAPRLGLIRTLLRMDRWPDAVTEAQAATQKFPANADAHGLLALALIRAGWLPPYADEARQSLTLDPQDYWGMIASGRSADWDAKREDAAALYRKASALHPELPDAWLGLLQTVSGKNASQERQAASAAYVKIDPHGQPHDREWERLNDLHVNAAAYANSFGNAPLFQRITSDSELLPSAPLTLPLQFAGDYILFPVTINDHRFRLIFDTGVGRNVILSQKAAKSLHLTPLAHSFMHGLTGRENSDVLKAETMTLGALAYHSIVISTMSQSPQDADGIFGGNILRDLVVTIDFSAATATFASGPNAAAPPAIAGDRVAALPFRLYHGHLFLSVVVNSRPLWALLDTGDYQSHFSLRVARELLKDVPAKQVRSGSISQAAIGNTEKHIDFIASRQEFNIILTENPPASIPVPTFGKSEVDRELSPGEDFEVGLMLGMSSLTYASRLTFDYPRRLLTFEYKDPDALPIGAEKK